MNRKISGCSQFTAAQLGAREIASLPQLGAKAELLARLGIRDLFHLLYYLPRRYEDRRITSPESLKPGQPATISGIIAKAEAAVTRRGYNLLRAELRTEHGPITAIWFNQPYLKKALRRGLPITVSGRMDDGLFGSEIAVADYEIGDPRDAVHVGRIVPFYGATEDLSQRTLRRLMFRCIRNYAPWAKDPLPLPLRSRLHLPSLAESLVQVHFPTDFEALERARERLVFEELFLFQLGLSRIQKVFQRQGVARRRRSGLPEDFIRMLPYDLTAAQRRVLQQIGGDLAGERRMYRLLQGDVGCGKTVVAMYALFYAVAAGFQGVLMAPTEVLAEQHFLIIKDWAGQLGVRAALLTGAMGRKEREDFLEALKHGRIDIVVGTHALLEEQVAFDNLGLIVIDEQHRFGVRQRDLIVDKAPDADVLVMTATPIPRSLALTLYGDLDLSVIDELPPGRQPVKTYFLQAREKQRVYQFLRQELQAGHQAYVVCSLIEESEKLEAEAAVQRAAELQADLPEYRVGLLHGRMKMEDKERVMNSFRSGEIQVLVATSVIEVGIDVANASLIIIEGAERFGLSQLHQLRGRVGRGEAAGYCVLVGDPQTDEARERIKALVRCQDGFQVAEKDLEIRGPGQLMGTRQHGLSDFQVVDIFRDAHLIEETRNMAAAYVDLVDEELAREIAFRFPSLIYGLKF